MGKGCAPITSCVGATEIEVALSTNIDRGVVQQNGATIKAIVTGTNAVPRSIAVDNYWLSKSGGVYKHVK